MSENERAHELYRVVVLAERRAEHLAVRVADTYVSGLHVYTGDVTDYRWARDCARIAFVTWHLEQYEAFPQWWRSPARVLADRAVTVTP